MSERLHKVLAGAGVGSRRKCEELIQQGRVVVNGETVTQLGTKADLSVDRIVVDGRPLAVPKPIYLLMNKPKGFVTTVADPKAKRTVMELLPRLASPVHPVGRLDKDSEGALIFTNDGELTNRLTHPRYGVEKTYKVVVSAMPGEDALKALRTGVWLAEGKTTPATVKPLGTKDGGAALEIVLHEGKNRQVRRMLAAVGLDVVSLKRTRIGNLSTYKLPRGHCRMLSKVEVASLKRAVGL